MRGGQQLPELPVLTTVRLRACRLDACANRLLWRSPALRVLDCDGPAVNLRAAALFWCVSLAAFWTSFLRVSRRNASEA